MGTPQIGWGVLAFFLPVLLELAALNLVLPLLQQSGAERPNYLGKMIPVAAGITFPLALVIAFLPYRFIGVEVGGLLTGIILMSLLGLIDDLLGNRETMGFKGHIRSLLKGKLTTGGLKMLMGGMVALYAASYFTAVWYWWLVNGLIIALATNLINLFDLRPGRAIKAFMLFFIPLGFFLSASSWWQLLPVLGVILAYFPFDLQARTMMGDTGSNVLGFTLGYLAASIDNPILKISALLILITLTLLSEKLSFSALIEKVALFRYIDQLGRKQKVNEQY